MRKKLLSIVLTLCMVVTMIPLFAGVAFAGEEAPPSITYIGPDGKSVVITASEINDFAKTEQEFTKRTIDKNTKEEVDFKITAKYADLAALLREKGATLPDCAFAVSDTNGIAYTYRQDTKLYVYTKTKTEDEITTTTFHNAVNGGWGFNWADNLTTINGLNHQYGDQWTCTNQHNNFNETTKKKITETCGVVAPKEKLPAATLAATDFTWDGQAKQPAVTVKDGSKTLKEGTDYAVSYDGGRKNIGTYAVTVTGKGHYEGTQTVSFKINPKGTSLKKVKAARKRLTVKWKKQAKKMPSSVIGGYQIQCSQKKDFSSGNKTVKVKGMKKTTKRISKLTSKKTYYVRVRTFKKVGKTTYYSAWSKVKKAKVK